MSLLYMFMTVMRSSANDGWVLAVGEGKHLDARAGADLQGSPDHVVAAGDLARLRRPVDRQCRRLSVLRHDEVARPTRNDVDVFGPVIQVDARRIAVGRRALVVELPRSFQGERVVGQLLRKRKD